MTFILNAATNNPVPDWSLTALFIVLTIAVIAFTVWLLVRSINAEGAVTLGKGKIGFGTALLIIILAGALIRIVFTFVSAGNRDELKIALDAAEEWIKYGPSEYIRRYFSDLNSSDTGRFLYPLTYYYVGLTAGSLMSAGLSSSSVLVAFSLKLPLIIADAVTALVIYKLTAKYRNKQVALILASFICFCPLFIFASAVWTSVHSLLACLIAVSFCFLVEKKHILSIAVYAVTLLIVKDASYLFPLYLVYYAYTWVRSIMLKDKYTAFVLPVTLIACVALQYLICLPLTSVKYSGDVFATIGEIFFYPLTQLYRFSDNGLSIYNVFMKGGALTTVIFRSQQSIFFIIAFSLIAASVTAVVYFGKRNRAVLTVVAAFIVLLYQTVYFDMSVTSVLPSIILLIMAFAYVKDKRLLKIVFSETLIAIVTMSLVFVCAGYYNYLPIEQFFSLTAQNNMQLANVLWGKISIITLSVLSIANLAYFTKVIIDVAMSDKIRPLGGKQDISLVDSVAYFLK